MLEKAGFFAFVMVPVIAASACVPKRDIPSGDVPKLTRLDHVMDVQATVADPQFKKIGKGTYGDADYAAFSNVADRIQATSLKTKDFSRGPGFDALADRLHDEAATLGSASQNENPKSSSDALAAMKATCKECHKKFR